jgi:hypothetical protein
MDCVEEYDSALSNHQGSRVPQNGSARPAGLFLTERG